MHSEHTHVSAGDPAEPVVFRGDAATYFRIWLVNLAMTVVTLGVWSAWAKVRRNRYLYGNTAVFGHSFDYTANGWTILKGRLIAVALIAAYGVLGHVEPLAQALAAVLLLPALPWIADRALAFALANTMWRNVRFHWHGHYRGTAGAFLLWPVLAGLSLGTLVPFATRASQSYLAGHSRFGVHPFAAPLRVGPFYGALGLTVALAAIFLAVYTGILMLLAGVEESEETASLSVVAGLFFALALYAVPVAFYRARARNITLGALVLDGDIRFRSSMSGLRLAWITITNFLATVASLGLLAPWATIRLWRYQCATVAIDAPHADLTRFTDTATAGVAAAGQEIADFGGIGIGV